MIFTKSASLFMRVLILCSLTLFLQCFALPNTVQRIGEDDSFQSFKTRRVLSDNDGVSDKTVFFIIFFVGLVIIISLAMYSCKNGCCTDEHDPDSGATVHPPPRHLSTMTPQVHVPPVNPNFAYDNASYTVPPQPGFIPPFAAPASAPPQQDNSHDRPPDYATVTMSDLGQGHYGPSFPEVVKKKPDSPPPKFEDNSSGYTFK